MAIQSAFQKYSAALNDWQANGGRASGPPPKEVRDFLRSQGQARDADLKSQGYGPSKLDTVNKAIDKQLKDYDKFVQKEANQRVADNAPKHARLIADVDSTCLEELTWKDGVATATFYRGGQIVYDYPMSRDEFIDWVSSDSLGKYGNDNVF